MFSIGARQSPQIRFCSPGKLLAHRALVADGVTFAGSSGGGSTISGGVATSNADAAGFISVQFDFLDIVIKNPFKQTVSGFRVAPPIASMCTDKAVGFGGALKGFVMIHTA